MKFILLKEINPMRKFGSKNLTYTQRLQLETLYNAKVSKKEIAEQLGVSLRTIYRELERGKYEHITKQDHYLVKGVLDYSCTKKEQRYSATISQERYDYLCTAKGRPLKIGNNYEYIRYIENAVKTKKQSACAILGQMNRNKVFNFSISKTTLYRYIELGFFENIKIAKKEKKQYRKTQMKRAPRGISIERRPMEINERKTFGHWELDCVCGPTKSCILAFTERLTRQELIFKIPNQKAQSVVTVLNSLEREYGKMFPKIFKSITVDNGCEFSNVKGLEKSIFSKNKRTTFYYCHPYSAYERGSNERLNREIRRIIPKGTDLSKYSKKDISEVQTWLNNYPRKVLGYATSQELFNEHLLSVA